MTTLKQTVFVMPAASLGRDNPLPDLRAVSDAHADIEIDEKTVTKEESKYMGWGRVSTILPYTVRDGYGRARRARDFKAFTLENAHLRAVFLPELGGRLWSLYDKDLKRELLHVNPVFQPCNLALRNAWISGGVEWNAGIIGHTPFTVDDLVCQRLTLSDGTPVLRMFEYERVRRIFFRVEALLPEDSRQLYVRVRLDNASMEDTAVYWWSNMAVNETPDTRVIVPADKAYRYGYGGKLAKIPIPYMRAEADKLRGGAARLARENGGTLDMDISRPTGIPQSMDFFFDVPKAARPFIAALDRDGVGMCQTSTHELRGRKLFVWGMGAGGRHWQTFLSVPGSAYIELQSGLARTQLEHLPMKGGETISWLESYGALTIDPAKAQTPVWADAVAAAADELEKTRPAQAMETLHARLKAELDGQNGEVLHKGEGYARAEQALLGDGFSTAGLSLDGMRIGAGESAWLALARKGALPCPAPTEAPKSYQLGARWEKALENSSKAGKSDHWYGWYQLGVMRAAKGDGAGARTAFRQSLAHAENPWAQAGMAALARAEGDHARAAEYAREAVREKPCRALVLLALDAMAAAGQYREIGQLIDTLPDALRRLGRVKIYRILAFLRTGNTDGAEKLLNRRIVLADVREGDVMLTDLWYECRAARIYGQTTEAAIEKVRETETPPKHLDFRMQ